MKKRIFVVAPYGHARRDVLEKRSLPSPKESFSRFDLS